MRLDVRRNWIFLSIVALFSNNVYAYVCSRVPNSSGQESGAALSWFGRQIHYSFFSSGTADLPGTNEFTTLRDSFDPWVSATSCTAPTTSTDLVFIEDALSNTDVVGHNFLDGAINNNLLIFRDTDWPHVGQGGIIIALTTTSYSPQTGEIFDADIEFNSAQFNFTNGDTGVATDLMNTAVHEIGHVIGLGHSSTNDATMYFDASLGEVKKRDLHCDDRNAVTFKYPTAQPVGYCDPPASICGFCAEPAPLTNTTDVSVSGFDDGQDSGCGCQNNGALPWLAALLFLVLRISRRSAR